MSIASQRGLGDGGRESSSPSFLTHSLMGLKATRGAGRGPPGTRESWAVSQGKKVSAAKDSRWLPQYRAEPDGI